MSKKKLLTLSLAASLALSATTVSADTLSKQATEKVHVNKDTQTPDFISGTLTEPTDQDAKEPE